jgi:hypothetical protein
MQTDSRGKGPVRRAKCGHRLIERQADRELDSMLL